MKNNAFIFPATALSAGSSGVDDNGYARVSNFGTGIDALVEAWSVSKKIICTAGETYEFTSVDHVLRSNGEDVDIVAPDSSFAANVQEIPIWLRGGWDSIQSPTAISADRTSWTVPDASLYAVNDVLKIRGGDTTPLWHYIGGSGRKGEFVVVRSIAGNVVTFTLPTIYAYYTTETTCQIGKLRTNSIRADIGSLYIHTSQATWTKWATMMVEAAFNPEIRVRRSPRMGEDLVDLLSCYGGTANVGSITGQVGGPTDSPGSYGIGSNNCEHMRLRVGLASNVWAATDGGSLKQTGRGTELSQYGHNAYNTLEDSEAHGNFGTPYAWHHGTWRNRHVNCRSYGSTASAFSYRGMHNVSTNCVSVRDQNGGGAIRQSGFGGTGAIGLRAGRSAYDGSANLFTYISTDGDGGSIATPVAYIHGSGAGVWGSALHYDGPLEARYAVGAMTDDSYWEDFECINPTTEYVAQSAGGGSVTIDDFYFAADIPPLATLSRIIGMGSDNLVLRNGQIIDSRPLSSRAIVNAGAVLDIRNVTFDLTGALGSFGLITDNALPLAKLVISGVAINSVSTLAWFYHPSAGNALPDAASQVGGVVANKMSAWASGFTDTDFAAFVTSTIIRNGIPISPGLSRSFLNLADDTIGTIPVNGAALISLSCGIFGDPSPQGTLAVRATTSNPQWCTTLTMRDATGIIVTGTPITTVAAATDGSVTICPGALDGNILVINRAGGTRKIGYAVVASV